MNLLISPPFFSTAAWIPVKIWFRTRRVSLLVNCSVIWVKPRMSVKRMKASWSCPPRLLLPPPADWSTCLEPSLPRKRSRVWRLEARLLMFSCTTSAAPSTTASMR